MCLAFFSPATISDVAHKKPTSQFANNGGYASYYKAPSYATHTIKPYESWVPVTAPIEWGSTDYYNSQVILAIFRWEFFFLTLVTRSL